MSKKILGVVTALVIVAAVLVGVNAQAQTVSCANIDAMLSALGVTDAAKVAQAKVAFGCGTATPAAYTFTRNLTIGSTGADVTALQTMLGVTPATGYFGAITKAAVMAYQTSKGIAPAAGYVGPLTRAALNAAVVVVPPVTPVTPVTPGTTSSVLEGTDGTISDVSSISTLSNEEVGDGQNNVKVLGLDVEASKDGDIALKSVKVKFTSTGGAGESTKVSDYMDSVSVYMGSDKIGSADIADFNKDSSGVYSKTISLTDAVIKADATAKIYLAVDAVSNLDSTDLAGADFNVQVVNIRYVDGGGVTTTDTDTGDIDSNVVAVNFVDFATSADTAIKASLDSTSPDSAVVIVDDNGDTTDGVVLLKGKLKVEGDSDIWLDELPVTFTSVGHDIDVITGNVTLTIDGEEYSESVAASATTTSVVVFDNLDLTISAGDTVNFTVTADIASTENDVITNGDTLLASVNSTNMDNLVAEDEEGDQVATNVTSGTAIGEAQSFYDEGIKVTLSGTPTITKTSGTINGDSDIAVATIKVKVEAIGDTMYVAKASTGTAEVALNNILASADADVTIDVIDVDTNAELDSTTGYIVEEGAPEYFTFTVTMSTAESASQTARASVTSIAWGSTAGTYDQTYDFNMTDVKSPSTTILKH